MTFECLWKPVSVVFQFLIKYILKLTVPCIHVSCMLLPVSSINLVDGPRGRSWTMFVPVVIHIIVFHPRLRHNVVQKWTLELT